MTEKIMIERRSDMLRPYSATTKNGNVYEIHDIVFYCDGAEVMRVGQGWLEFRRNGSKHDITAIQINQPVRANKINLDRTDNFIAVEPDKWSRKNKYTLFVRVARVGGTGNGALVNPGECKITPLGERLSLETETERCYLNSFTVSGLTYTYDLYTKDEDDKITHTPTTETADFLTDARYYSKTELTPFGQEAKTLRAEMEKDGIKIGSWEIEKILKNYEVKRRVKT